MFAAVYFATSENGPSKYFNTWGEGNIFLGLTLKKSKVLKPQFSQKRRKICIYCNFLLQLNVIWCTLSCLSCLDGNCTLTAFYLDFSNFRQFCCFSYHTKENAKWEQNWCLMLGYIILHFQKVHAWCYFYTYWHSLIKEKNEDFRVGWA